MELHEREMTVLHQVRFDLICDVRAGAVSETTSSSSATAIVLMPLLLRGVLVGGLPTLHQYLLNPMHANRVLGSETVYHSSFGASRMPYPDAAAVWPYCTGCMTIAVVPATNTV